MESYSLYDVLKMSMFIRQEFWNDEDDKFEVQVQIYPTYI